MFKKSQIINSKLPRIKDCLNELFFFFNMIVKLNLNEDTALFIDL